ncbi:MAG: type I DNA topoisomerase [Patescibacteria group bacterium]|nr:type I DNA topoisomerase [Patescibacteria group bacterium]
MELIIVESPTKSKTLEKFLDKKYQIAASFGHIRDLPKSKLGIDIEKNFEPQYVIPTKSRKTVNSLKKLAEKAEKVILAVDEDREGEAIAFHLKEALKLKDYERIVFHEITERAIKEALKNPRKINIDLVNSQVARRVLDRIVGYKLSPFLWKKVTRGLSAGRVQSIVLRLIVEREREIEKFVPEEYWSIIALLDKKDKKGNEFEAFLIEKNNKKIPKLGIKDKKETEKIVKNLEKAEFQIENIHKKEVKKNPLPPFTTSTLQQTAGQRLYMSSQKTMFLAQRLYEKGLISYHRTDSLNLSQEALSSAQNFIIKNFGKNYWPGFSRKYKTKSKGAQEAHEAIRPTDVTKAPENIKLDSQQLRLYTLIWQRFLASQMNQAIFDSIGIKIKANDYLFQANGQTLKFDGFLKVYETKFKEALLPDLQEKEILELTKLTPLQHFTKPPARYSEPTLIKVLEKNGIGRPSTYAPTISTIERRNYAQKNEQRKFAPTEIGIVVNDLLVEHFPVIVNIKFTANMENNLDKIAQGKEEWSRIVKDFYEPFEKNLKQKEGELSKQEIAEEKTDKVCPKCKSPMIIKLGRFGKFYACTGFPKCKHTESLKDNKLNIKCPKCKKGEITEKRTRKGKIFYGCNTYPECDFAVWDKPTDEMCPDCNWPLIKTKKNQIKCSNPDCKTA